MGAFGYIGTYGHVGSASSMQPAPVKKVATEHWLKSQKLITDLTVLTPKSFSKDIKG